MPAQGLQVPSLLQDGGKLEICAAHTRSPKSAVDSWSGVSTNRWAAASRRTTPSTTDTSRQPRTDISSYNSGQMLLVHALNLVTAHDVSEYSVALDRICTSISTSRMMADFEVIFPRQPSAVRDETRYHSKDSSFWKWLYTRRGRRTSSRARGSLKGGRVPSMKGEKRSSVQGAKQHVRYWISFC